MRAFGAGDAKTTVMSGTPAAVEGQSEGSLIPVPCCSGRRRQSFDRASAAIPEDRWNDCVVGGVCGPEAARVTTRLLSGRSSKVSRCPLGPSNSRSMSIVSRDNVCAEGSFLAPTRLRAGSIAELSQAEASRTVSRKDRWVKARIGRHFAVSAQGSQCIECCPGPQPCRGGVRLEGRRFVGKSYRS